MNFPYGYFDYSSVSSPHLQSSPYLQAGSLRKLQPQHKMLGQWH